MSGRWENLYEYYKSNNAQERMEFLKNKIDKEQATPEEEKEYKKMKRVEGYLPLVDNLRDAIDALDSNLEMLKEEYNNREENATIERIEKEAAKLEKEIEEKRAEAEKLHEVAENDDYWDKIFEVQNMEDTLGTLKEELSETQKKESKYPELAGLSQEELRKEIFKTSGQISRCNLAAELYMRGESQETIKFAVKKYNKKQKFTVKDSLPLTREELEQKQEESREDDVTNTGETKKIEEPVTKKLDSRAGRKIVQDPIGVIHGADESRQLLNIEEIRAKHGILSRLAKIPLLGKIAERRLNTLVEKEYKELKEEFKRSHIEAEHTEANQPEQSKIESSKEKRAKFIESLSEYDVTAIAEKGIDKLDEERKREKLIDAKERAVLRQNEKFGDNYSQRSGDQSQLNEMYKDDGEER